MKNLFYIILGGFLFSCNGLETSRQQENVKISSDLSSEQETIPQNYFKEERQYGNYWVKVVQKEFHGEATLTVMLDSNLVLVDSQIVEHVDRVVVRDLDADGLLEIYMKRVQTAPPNCSSW